MTRSIGLRVAPKEVWFSIVERDDARQSHILVSACLTVPAALDPPQQLRFVRQTIGDTIQEYGVTLAGIRLAEATAQRVVHKRIHIEGVLQELLASSMVEDFFYGPIATIASLLGEPERAAIKRYVAGEVFEDIDGWEAMGASQRESVLVAVAAHGLEVL